VRRLSGLLAERITIGGKRRSTAAGAHDFADRDRLVCRVSICRGAAFTGRFGASAVGNESGFCAGSAGKTLKLWCGPAKPDCLRY
jgi:hypothetical protein